MKILLKTLLSIILVSISLNAFDIIKDIPNIEKEVSTLKEEDRYLTLNKIMEFKNLKESIPSKNTFKLKTEQSLLLTDFLADKNPISNEIIINLILSATIFERYNIQEYYLKHTLNENLKYFQKDNEIKSKIKELHLKGVLELKNINWCIINKEKIPKDCITTLPLNDYTKDIIKYEIELEIFNYKEQNNIKEQKEKVKYINDEYIEPLNESLSISDDKNKIQKIEKIDNKNILKNNLIIKNKLLEINRVVSENTTLNKIIIEPEVKKQEDNNITNILNSKKVK